MSTQKDIIGIVKELQGKICFCRSDLNACKKCVAICDQWRTIAKALIIAVEALERIDEAEWSPCHECEGRSELVFIAGKALSGIRSLPKK